MSDQISEQPAVIDHGGLLRIRMDLAYDGSGFHGWAVQPGVRTVAGELTAAIGRVLRVTDPAMVVAGRTDAGVHATGQVCHIDVAPEAWPGERIAVRALNAVLPADIRVRGAHPAAPGFDARFSALHRGYQYLISDSGLLDPRARNSVLVRRRSLDADAMHEAAQVLLGEHDFAAFCKARPGASSVRTVLSADTVRSIDARDPDLIVVSITADAFCHSMVRSVVGALMAVGESRLGPEDLRGVLDAGRRVPLFATAPAHGLALVEVGYPVGAELARQAARAKRYRG